MSIASWIAGLFAGVDLSPSDLMTAIFLTSAAQNMRRRMRIRKALESRSKQHLGSRQQDGNPDEGTSELGGRPAPTFGLHSGNKAETERLPLDRWICMELHNQQMQGTGWIQLAIARRLLHFMRLGSIKILHGLLQAVHQYPVVERNTNAS